MKAGGGAKQNASLKQGAQVSTATQRAATTTVGTVTPRNSVEIPGENLCRIFEELQRSAKTHTDLQRFAKILQRSSMRRIFKGSSKIS